MTADTQQLNQNATARVFVFEHVRQDLSNARDFGTVTYLFDNKRARSRIFDCVAVQAEILRALQDENYNPKVDLLCITGHLIPMTLLVAAVVCEYGAPRVLYFDTLQKTYFERTIGYEFDDDEQ
jgi:hypothetical protein